MVYSMAMEIEHILAERNSSHGDFEDNAFVSQALKEIAHSGKTWEYMSDVEREAVEMILFKISRWVSAPKVAEDTIRDIIGYATLADQYMHDEDQFEVNNPTGTSLS